MATQPEVSLTGRAPTSPGDFYVKKQIVAHHIEHALTDSLAKALTTLEVVTGCTLIKGGMVQGINSTITLSDTSDQGTTACSIYAKVKMGVLNSVAGRTSVIEGRLEIPATAVNQDTMAVLCLDFSNGCTTGINNYLSSYIQLRERSALGGGSQQMNNLFNFSDITPAAVGIHDIFSTSADCVATHKLKFVASGTYYWILCTTTAPA